MACRVNSYTHVLTTVTVFYRPLACPVSGTRYTGTIQLYRQFNNLTWRQTALRRRRRRVTTIGGVDNDIFIIIMNKYQKARVRIDHCQSCRVIAAVTRFGVFFSKKFQPIGRASPRPAWRKARVSTDFKTSSGRHTTIIIITYVCKTAYNNIISYVPPIIIILLFPLDITMFVDKRSTHSVPTYVYNLRHFSDVFNRLQDLNGINTQSVWKVKHSVGITSGN